jgi:hypothetical protein
MASQTKPPSPRLGTAYRRFLTEQCPSKKEEAGRDLVRAIFGKDAFAED